MKRCLNLSASFSAAIRVVTSVAPPGPNGTMTRTGRFGKSACARARRGIMAPAARAPVSALLREISVAGDDVACGCRADVMFSVPRGQRLLLGSNDERLVDRELVGNQMRPVLADQNEVLQMPMLPLRLDR